MSRKIIFLTLLLLLAFGTALFAEGENLDVKIAVMGPGDELYFWWGHIALVIEDTEKNVSRFYDYGIFSFNNENFFVNFAFGRLLYRCGVSSSIVNIAGYINTNRDIKIYTLDLPPDVRQKVKDFADVNVLPENRNYYYHHFKDNCSTRIRDIIDLATDGQFEEQYRNAPSRFTLRQHVRRHTWFSPAADWILNFWMGQVIDTPITVWEDMFLPSEVGRNMENFWYTDANGAIRKLVVRIETLNTAKNRPAVLNTPRKQWPRELAFSLVLSAIFCSFFFMQSKRKKAGRILAGFSMSLAGLVFGFAGLLLYFLNLFTNHDYTYQNANMLFCTPLLLASVPFGIIYALTKKQDKLLFYGMLLRLVWGLSVLGIFISMLIKLLPMFYQQNLTDQMLMLPIALVFTLHPLNLREDIEKFLKRKKA
jgi:glutaredoxin-related protein